MKKVFIGGIVAIIGLGVYSALRTGEKSPIFAKGQLELAPELAPFVEGIDTVFLVIWDEEQAMPMPFAAAKFTLKDKAKSGSFFEFALTKEKMQLMGSAMSNASVETFPKLMRIKARLDRDGMGGSDQSGDIVGEIRHVTFGSEGVKITLDRKIPQTSSLTKY